VLLFNLAIGTACLEATEKDDKENRSPKQVLESFFRLLAEGELSKAKELLVLPLNLSRLPFKNEEEALKQIAKRDKERKSGTKVTQVKIIDDLAVALTDSQFAGGRREVEPVFFRKINGSWRIVLTPTISELKKYEWADERIRTTADRLNAWYLEQKKVLLKSSGSRK